MLSNSDTPGLALPYPPNRWYLDLTCAVFLPCRRLAERRHRFCQLSRLVPTDQTKYSRRQSRIRHSFDLCAPLLTLSYR